jgi:flavodoxin
MKKEVLVTFASKYGATAEIAEKIEDVLKESGLQSQILPVNQVRGIRTYDAFVLGSAVYIGQWRKEVVKFLKKMLIFWPNDLLGSFRVARRGKVIQWNYWMVGSFLRSCSLSLTEFSQETKLSFMDLWMSIN